MRFALRQDNGTAETLMTLASALFKIAVAARAESRPGARRHRFFAGRLGLGWAMRQAMVSTSRSSSTVSADSVSVV